MTYDRTLLTLAEFLSKFDPFQAPFYQVPMSTTCRDYSLSGDLF